MAEWQKIKISQFLKEREGRYDPGDEAVLGFKRLNKIDFSGEIHLSDKGSKTDMIIVEPGDLVISGINVSKGALAVYRGEEPITATIHYSSYAFDERQIDIDYFKRFVRSQSFVQALKDQVKGGIKTEIKPKHFLPLEIHLPDIESQKEIVSFFKGIENEMDDLSGEITHQQSFLKQLRQRILQEAIEGKLTTNWRDKNPDLLSGDNHASKLLEKIKTEKERLIEKGKIKKDKPLAPITDAEKPFPLPNGWAWVRFSEICEIATNCVSPYDYPNHAHLAPDNIEKCTGRLLECKTVKDDNVISVNHLFYPGMLVYSKVRPRLRKVAKVDFEGLCSADMYPLVPKCNPDYLKIVMLSNFFDGEVYRFDNRVKMPKINQDQLGVIPIPLAPLADQQVIVERVDKLMAMIGELEKQVSERKEQSEMLMQSVLREAFAKG
ncbi:MAG: restriction endonuclease subunit S [Candidatus Brocadiaceae bacterium]|nr:restriction endonuclease subunit S [Candidatus Brocadiaceae bacterium]